MFRTLLNICRQSIKYLIHLFHLLDMHYVFSLCPVNLMNAHGVCVQSLRRHVELLDSSIDIFLGLLPVQIIEKLDALFFIINSSQDQAVRLKKTTTRIYSL